MTKLFTDFEGSQTVDANDTCPICRGIGGAISSGYELNESEPCHSGPYFPYEAEAPKPTTMRYKAYIDSAQKVAMAQYRKGFKPENETFETREEALIALAQKLFDKSKPEMIAVSQGEKMNQKSIQEITIPLNAWQVAALMFGQKAVDCNHLLAGEAAQEMKAAGWTFLEYDENGEEVWQPS